MSSCTDSILDIMKESGTDNDGNILYTGKPRENPEKRVSLPEVKIVSQEKSNTMVYNNTDSILQSSYQNMNLNPNMDSTNNITEKDDSISKFFDNHDRNKPLSGKPSKNSKKRGRRRAKKLTPLENPDATMHVDTNLQSTFQNMTLNPIDGSLDTDTAKCSINILVDNEIEALNTSGMVIKRKTRRRIRIRKQVNTQDQEKNSIDLSDPQFSINNHNHDILALQNLYFLHNKINNFKNSSKPDKQKTQVINSESFEPKVKFPTPGGSKQTSKSTQNVNYTFDAYFSEETVLKGLETDMLIKGSLRINPKAYQQAYVSHPNKKSPDIMINGLKDRNRALENDIVVVQVRPPAVETSGKQTGRIVYIMEKNHPRTCVGKLEIKDTHKSVVYFYPRDKRMPILQIPLIDCPPAFDKDYKKYESFLFLAKITNWTNTRFASGTILETVGHSKELCVQSKAILLENCLDVTPYGSDVKHLYPDETFVIPTDEIKKREDFRNKCVFTIDPPTARDLDDAVSCELMSNGNYEIGVHISDVTYFLKEGNILDEKVARKATTVYLMDGTFHMLPKDLCLLCSLLPGSDKLTFSVIWEISKEGKIINHRFARCIINSCCQLSYNHVQYMIKNPGVALLSDDFPEIIGPYPLSQISKIVTQLYELSVIFRKQRYDSGALRINQSKLSFKLDPHTGLPVSYQLEEHNESHSLIEEFMLLANCTVAARIYEDFPSLAFLRHHPPPKPTITVTAEYFKSLGINLDISSAGNLQKSLAKYTSDSIYDPTATVLHNFLLKSLARAEYFCVNGCGDDDTHHYSLNIPLYTHFTSPIRRYADIVVHRLLCGSLSYSPRPSWNPEYVQNTAIICNKQKYNAKKAGDMSSELYIMKYIDLNSPMEQSAVVLDVLEKGVDILIFSMGLVKRIYYDNFSDNLNQTTFIGTEKKGVQNLVIVKWMADNSSPEIIQILKTFDTVRVEMKKTEDILLINIRMLKPNT